MALTIFWTDFAKTKLDDIFEYYKEESGSRKIARNVVTYIVEYADVLKSQPHIGQREELLLDKPQEFRYLVFKNYKLIYWINTVKSRIDIAHVFDTRQEPFNVRQFK